MKYLKKTIIVFILLLMVITGVVTYINSKLFSKDIQGIIKSLNLDIKVEDAKFVGYGKIKITGLVLYDKDKKPAIEANEGYIYINPFSISRVRKIDVYSPNVILEKKEGMKFNIVEMFAGESDKIDRTSRIGRINFYNAKLDYRDTSYDKLIQKNLNNVNGYVHFSKAKGISLEAAGDNNGEKIGVVLKIFYPQKRSPELFLQRKAIRESKIYFELNFDKFGIFPEAIQYVPFDGLEVYDGKISGQLKMGLNKKFSGNLNVENGTVKYVDYDEILKNVNADVILKDNNVDIATGAELNGGKLDLGIKFLEKTKTVKLAIKSNNMDYSDIRKYKLIKEQNIEASGRITGTFNANLDLDKKIYEFDGFLSSPNLRYSGYNFRNLKTNLVYDKNSILTLNNISFGFNETISNVHIAADARALFSYNTKQKAGSGTYELDNKGSDFSIERINGNFEIDKNNVVRSNFFSQETDGNFAFDTRNKSLEVNASGKQFFDLKYGENKFTLKPVIRNLKINLDKFLLVSGSADIDIAKNKYFDTAKVSAVVRNGNFDINANAVISGQNIRATGTTDSKFNHRYKVSGSNIHVKKLLDRFDIKVAGMDKSDLTADFNANIYSNGGKLKGDFNIASQRGKYFVEYEKLNISGDIEDLLAGRLQAKVSAGEIWLNYQRFKNLTGDVSYENNVITVTNFKNEDLSANVAFNIKDQNVNLNAQIHNYILYNVSKPEFNLKLERLDVNLSGNVNSLNGSLFISPSMVTIDNRYSGELKGNINVRNSVLILDELAWRKNTLKGTYDLNTQSADVYVHIEESKLEELYGMDNLVVSLNSDIRLQGRLDDFTVTGDINIGHMQYGDIKLPAIESTIAYKNGDIKSILKKGSLDITKFIVRGEEGEEILNTSTKVDDLATSQLDFVLNDKVLDLTSIKGLKEKGYSGIINYSLILRGDIDNFFVDLKAESDNFSVSGFSFNNLSIDAQANNKGLNIGQLYLEYENNPLLVNGYVTFTPIDYNINVLAENFNLDFLKAGKGMKDAGGIANLDVTFTPDNTSGVIDLQNFVFKDQKGSVDISELNANIDINNRKLVVNNFHGNYNGGTVNISGNLDIPGLAPDFAESKKLDLGDFDLRITLDKTNIKYGKTFDGVLSADLSFTEKELLGSVVVDKGKIADISQFVGEKKDSEETAGKKREKSIIDGLQSEIVDIIMGQYSANIRINMIKGIDLEIPSVSLVRNIRGVLKGEGVIMLNSGNISASGDFYVTKGKFTLSDRNFVLDQAEFYYGNSGFAGSEIGNPFVVVLATTNINNDQISVSISGNLSDPQIKFNSSLGLSQEQILALLIFDARTTENSDFETRDQNQQLGNLADPILNQLIFGSVIGTIEETFGLSAVSLKTNVQTQSADKKANGQDLGPTIAPSIYIQDNLYKDRLFWNVELGYGEESTASAGLDYNFWVTYKVSEKFGVNLGLQNLRGNDSLVNKTDYYLGVEFSTRFYDFGDFVRSLRKPKLEVVPEQDKLK
ncbi:translocation/assembly module TamB domain-containing protein [Sebaldella sp. S0638]|uniref:translocation/assembly module TamB domain-containing protein n=1 Tax=Sebaldella sp. S0638 TaxID=2957809 RepID=UPI00209C916D|nr:translocation/assembly module TamB domain-containing protein [Sebaldella sp. S0638]MCP1224081.1 translocation/assembly module TamB domain-containing protein [Sebaldella sp. S0638]